MKSTPDTAAEETILAFGTPAEILPGIFRLLMPLPFELSHINLWLLRGTHGWTIIDTGFNYGETLALWENVFRDFFQGKPVEDIVITHFHPDHFGLAGMMAEKADVTIRMTNGEFAMVQSLMDGDELRRLYTPYYTEAGLTGALHEKMIEKRLFYKKIVSTPPKSIQPLELDTSIFLGAGNWRVLGGGGHSPEHACLYNAKDRTFIAGDIVLPQITPNISFFPGNGPDHDPLADYFATLENVRQQVPDNVHVLPSHGEPFSGGLHQRIDEIKAHHEKRLARVREICTGAEKTAYDVMQALFSHRELSSSDLFFALGETLAHLVYEEKRGGLKKAIRDDVAYYITK